MFLFIRSDILFIWLIFLLFRLKIPIKWYLVFLIW